MIKLAPLIKEHERRSRQLRKSIFMNALQRGKFSSAYEKFAEGNGIYRGLKGSAEYPWWIVNPAKEIRKSRNTSNFYTGLLDRLPSWRQYPKRSRSIICSNNVNTATSFGNPLVVFPKNGARIGICPSYDFWDSFGIIRNRLSFPSMDDFNAIFIKIFSIIDNNLGKLAEELSEDIYDELINRLKKISKDEFLRATRLLHTKVAWLKRYEESVFEDITDNFNGDWEQYFDDLMNPEANKFQLQSIETYEKKSEFAQNEVWTDAVSLMVNESYVKELLQSPVKLPPKPGDPNLDITI